MLNSIPYTYARNQEPYTGKWQTKFAWLPTRIVIVNYTTVGGITWRKDPVYHWVWLKKYWVRVISNRAGITVNGRLLEELEYALNVFDLLRKS